MEKNNTFDKINIKCDEFIVIEPMMLGNLLDFLNDNKEDSKKVKLDLKLETIVKNKEFYSDILRNIKN